VQIAPLDEGDQFIPFGMRKSDGVRVLADPDPLVGDLDLGALRAKRAKGKLDRFHLDVLPAGPVQEPCMTSVVATDARGIYGAKTIAIGELSRQAGGNIETMRSTSLIGLLAKACREKGAITPIRPRDGEAEQQHASGSARPALYALGGLGAPAHFDI
jgi:hypothetical protein